jgi:hemolysin III
MKRLNKHLREPANFYTHVVPAIWAIPGALLLFYQSTSTAQRFAAVVYGICTVVLFGISATYHGYPKTEKQVRFWQKFDHCCIYLMIAGSYTPTTLLVFEGWIRWTLFSVVWLIALTGCTIKIFNRLKHRGLSLFIYISMGLLIVPLLSKMAEKLPFDAIMWLLVGGVFYIGGTFFYYQDKAYNRFVHSHEVWHVFVVAGALSHYVYNYAYLFTPHLA